MGRFRVEPGERPKKGGYSPTRPGSSSSLQNVGLSSPVMLENPERETRWYFKYFLGKEHQNFAGLDHNKQPFFFSIIADESSDGGLLHHRAILWTSKGASRLSLPYNSKGCSPKAMLRNFPGMREIEPSLKEIPDAKIQKELLLLEEQEGSVNFKFGIVCMNTGQTTDFEMLSNEEGDEDFFNLLHLLGDEVQLNGFEHYRGGLDIKGDTTGKTSLYTVFEGHEIMFHVSTMLPYSTANKQQIERKRHIGNDIVNIIFESGGDPENPTFSPTMMKSQFTHIFAVVTFSEFDGCYRMWVMSEESVPVFGPALHSPPVFSNSVEFRDFLLTKLINGEKAAFNSHVFQEKRERTTDLLIKDMYMEYIKTEHKPVSRRDSVFKLNKERRKEERLMEFIKIGQSLKMERYLSGDAPANLTMTSLYRKQPWEAAVVGRVMHWMIKAGDSWGKSCLFLAPEEGGLFFLNTETDARQLLIEKDLLIQKLNVIENFGLVICHSIEKGRDGYIYVFKLNALRTVLHKQLTLDRTTCKAGRIQASKGTHCFSVLYGLQLHIAMSIGHHVKILQWKYSAACPAWCLDGQILATNFVCIQDISVQDDPIALCLFEAQSLVLCTSYKTHCDLLSLRKVDELDTVCRFETKVSYVELLANCDEDQTELFVTYNNITMIFDVTGNHGVSAPAKIIWNSTPTGIAFVFPFIMAFTSDAMEIRLAINGSLLATVFMPCLHFLTAKNDIYFTAIPMITSPISIASLTFDFGFTARAVIGNRKDDIIVKLYKIALQQLQGVNQSRAKAHLSAPNHPSVRPRPSYDERTHQPLSKQRSNPSSTAISDGIKELPDGNCATCNSLSPPEIPTHKKSLVLSKSDIGAPLVAPATASRPHEAASREVSMKSDSGISSQGSVDNASVPVSPFVAAAPASCSDQ